MFGSKSLGVSGALIKHAAVSVATGTPRVVAAYAGEVRDAYKVKDAELAARRAGIEAPRVSRRQRKVATA